MSSNSNRQNRQFKKDTTPINRAIDQLGTFLSSVTEEVREIWKSDMRALRGVQYMSMEHLAIALKLRARLDFNNVDSKLFIGELEPYLSNFKAKLDTKLTDLDKRKRMAAHREVIFSYIVKLLSNEGKRQDGDEPEYAQNIRTVEHSPQPPDEIIEDYNDVEDDYE